MGKYNHIFLESKKMLRFKKKSEDFLISQLNKEYDNLTDSDKKELNLMARWEFAKPVKLRIPKRILMDYFKQRKKKPILTVNERK